MGGLSGAVLRRRNSHKPDVQRISGLNFMISVNAPACGRGLRRDQYSQQTIAVAFGAGVIDRDSRPLGPDRIGIVELPEFGVPRHARLQRKRPWNPWYPYPAPRSYSYSRVTSDEAYRLHQFQIESFARVNVNVLAFHYQHDSQPGRRANSAASQHTYTGDHPYPHASRGASACEENVAFARRLGLQIALLVNRIVP